MATHTPAKFSDILRIILGSLYPEGLEVGTEVRHFRGKKEALDTICKLAHHDGGLTSSANSAGTIAVYGDPDRDHDAVVIMTGAAFFRLLSIRAYTPRGEEPTGPGVTEPVEWDA